MMPKSPATLFAALILLTPIAALTENDGRMEPGDPALKEVEKRLERYVSFALKTDVAALTDSERKMLPLLIEAAQEMDQVFWIQAYGDKEQFLASLPAGPMRRYAEINYGPWDRLDDNKAFVPGVQARPDGANLYPHGLTREELEQAAQANPRLKDPYTLVRRDVNGKLEAVPYSSAYHQYFERAAQKLRAAATFAEDAGLKHYLELRAEALMSNDYRPSDRAWLDMKNNRLDIVIGPIESYEDALIGAKTAAEAYVLVKDKDWSQRLQRYAALLPELQRGLPVPAEYKKEVPGSDSDLGAYDVVYYAGDCNAGSKTIAINLPNDEVVQLEKGTRRLQLKNAMQAKFDKILVPIANLLMAQDQRAKVNFAAFFGNTMFHEVAHGLGIKKTIDGKSTVREALGEHTSALEEGKADMLGLYMIAKLIARGEKTGASQEEHDVTFMAGIFRSIRFGAASAHGVANLIRFNFFAEQGAFARDAASGTYRVDFKKLRVAADALSEKILRLQGDGDKKAVAEFVAKYGQQGETLKADLARLAEAKIPVDVVFEQGLEVLGLPPTIIPLPTRETR